MIIKNYKYDYSGGRICYTIDVDGYEQAMEHTKTELRAAIEMGRVAYGFEIKKDFYKKAQEQMLSTFQTSLF